MEKLYSHQEEKIAENRSRDTLFERRENLQRHASYASERLQYDAIKNGQTDRVLSIFQKTPDRYADARRRAGIDRSFVCDDCQTIQLRQEVGHFLQIFYYQPGVHLPFAGNEKHRHYRGARPFDRNRHRHADCRGQGDPAL